MYELIKVAERTYYINCPAKIGVYLSGENEAWLIDSGNDKDAGRRINKILNEQGWSLKGVAVTHSHADHIGGLADLKKRTGCLALSEGIERAVTENPLLEPTYLYGGWPMKTLKNKFLMAAPTIVDGGFELLPEGLMPVALPGHSFNMSGFMTSDGVFFSADSVFGTNIVEKYHVNFVYDGGAFLSTLDKLETTPAKLFVPSHAEPTDDIRELVRINREKTLEILEFIERCAMSPVRFDTILHDIFDHYGLTLDMNQYVLVGSTIRSYISYLIENGRLSAAFEGNRLLFVRV